MQFHILTLFPEMIMQGVSTSITGRAIEEKLIGVEAVDIREFSKNKHRKVDDYTYGGGAGMLMQAQPVFDAWEHVQNKITARRQADTEKKVRTVYVTPQGHTFNQRMAEEFAKEEDLIILCGHYEGIDERVLEEVVTDYVSIGDFVLTGGELAAMIMVDSISRLVPGVLHNEVSAETESFHGDLLEYPQYSRPRVWHDKEVPAVLLSGNTKNINKWRLEESVKRTKVRRPDLYLKYENLQKCKGLLLKQKLMHIDMIELIDRGCAKLIYNDGNEIILKDTGTNVIYHTILSVDSTEAKKWYINKFFDGNPEIKGCGTWFIIAHQKAVADKFVEAGSVGLISQYRHAVYTQREKLAINGLYNQDQTVTENGLVIRALSQDDICSISKNCSAELLQRIQNSFVAGAFIEDKVVGVISILKDGSVGQLYVEPDHRREKNATALETFIFNQLIENGRIPYMCMDEHEEAVVKLQEKMGLYFSKESLYRLEVL